MKRGSMAAILTLLFALAAAAGVFMYVKNAQHRAQAVQETVQVLVSKTDIPAGESLDPLVDAGNFAYRDVPREDLIKDVVTDPYQLQGQRTAYPILAGEQISPARFVGELQAAGGRYGLKPGMQVASLTLEGQRAAGGNLQQGDFIEAYGTFTLPNTQGAQTTRVIVQDAQVLSSTTDTTTGTGNVTVMLAVTPIQAEYLVYAQEQGHVWLTLLPPNERGALVPPVRSKEVK
jgi:pilus assembly protein CpaB